MRKLINRIDEKQYMIPLSRRQPFYYIDKAVISKHNDSVKIFKKEGNISFGYDLPIANIGCLILGSGTSITNEAIRIISARGCHCVFTGEGGMPIYSKTIHHRNSTNKIKQFKSFIDSNRRYNCSKILLEERAMIMQKFKPELPLLSINSVNSDNILGIEAAWAKSAYKYVCNKHKYSWPGKANLNKHHPLNLMNHLLYSLTDITISFCGYDSDLGIIHGINRGGGLCYDIADVYKPILILEQSIIHSLKESKPKEIREQLLEDIMEFDLIDKQIKLLERLFR